MRVDALVVGAGPAGATVARLLAQAGWSVALAEKAVFPRRKVCGEFISATTLPVLAACGIADAFASSAGPPVRRLALYAGKAMPTAPMPDGAGWGRALGREHLDTLLRDAAVKAGVVLHQPMEVTDLNRTKKGFVCKLEGASASELEAGLVIAAAGSWNHKGPFAVTAPPRPSDLFAFKAHFHGGALPEGLMPLLAFPGGYGGMVHSDDGRISLSCCLRRDVLAGKRKPGERAADTVLRHIIENTDGVRLALSGAERLGEFLSTGPIRPGIRVAYANGVFFTGNSAGEAHPIIAEGISMAIQSSWLLARALIATGPARPPGAYHEIGAAYTRAWRNHFALRLRAAAFFAQCAMHGPTRYVSAALVSALPSILTLGARLSGKAAIST
jgi:flavin-dependent dehydrogenase